VQYDLVIFVDPPAVPVITDYRMYNWSKFVFTWTHGYNDPKLITNYSAYYRSRFVFTEFVDVRLTCI